VTIGRVGAVVVALGLVSIVSGCGGSGTQQPNRLEVAKRRYQRQVAAGAIVPAHAEPKRQASLHPPDCMRAKASLGRSADTIYFSAVCFTSPKGGRVGFGLERAPLYGLRGTEASIVSFSKRPKVVGSGAIRPNGSCVSKRSNELFCSAGARGRIVLSGSLMVNPQTRCSNEVSIVRVSSPPCKAGEACSLVAIVRTLATGPPRGC
jgi:hypothetical protein